MSWDLIFTRNIGWKALSVLSAIAIWYTINGRHQNTDPKRVKEQTLIEPKIENPTTIGQIDIPETITNRVNVIQNFAIRILQTPNDTNSYILDPTEVKLELASDADPAPDLTSPAAIKVFLDPFDLPNGVNETNLNVRVSLTEDGIEDIILKNFTPKEVKVTRIEKTLPKEAPKATKTTIGKIENEENKDN